MFKNFQKNLQKTLEEQKMKRRNKVWAWIHEQDSKVTTQTMEGQDVVFIVGSFSSFFFTAQQNKIKQLPCYVYKKSYLKSEMLMTQMCCESALSVGWE